MAVRAISCTRYFCHARGGDSNSVGLDSYEKAWRRWGRTQNSTSIFEGYLRRMMRLPTSAPELPCRCEHKQKVLFLKFFLGWLERPKGVKVGLEIPQDYPFLRRYVEPGYVIPEDEAWYSIDARAVFRRLNARIIYLIESRLRSIFPFSAAVVPSCRVLAQHGTASKRISPSAQPSPRPREAISLTST